MADGPYLGELCGVFGPGKDIWESGGGRKMGMVACGWCNGTHGDDI